MKKFFLYLSILAAIFSTSCGGSSSSALGIPQNVAVAGGSTALTISWDAVSGATSYNLYWSTTPGVTKTTGTKVESVTSPYIKTDLRNATNYYFVVTAADASTESDVSSEVSGAPAFKGELDMTSVAVENTNQYNIVKVASDPDNNTYVLLPGYGTDVSFLYKFNSAGQIDRSFGTEGLIYHDASSDGIGFIGIDTDSSGSLYVTGYSVTEGPVFVMRLWKFTSAGVLDTTFGGGNGYVSNAELVSAQSMGLDVVVVSDNNIAVAGGTEGNVALWRYSSTGTNLSAAEAASEGIPLYIAANSAGSLFISSWAEGADPTTLWKFLSNGSGLDTTFNSTGKIELSTDYIGASASLFDSSGNIILPAGVPGEGDSQILHALKFDTTGAVVSSFGTNGVANITGDCESETRMAMPLTVSMEPGFNLIAGGVSATSETDLNDLMCGVNSSTGALNTSLFTDGIADDVPNVMLMASDIDSLGRVVEAGSTFTIDESGNMNTTGYKVLRYK